jgi:hypothetical protein
VNQDLKRRNSEPNRGNFLAVKINIFKPRPLARRIHDTQPETCFQRLSDISFSLRVSN